MPIVKKMLKPILGRNTIFMKVLEVKKKKEEDNPNIYLIVNQSKKIQSITKL